jgi:hypothetical protein
VREEGRLRCLPEEFKALDKGALPRAIFPDKHRHWREVHVDLLDRTNVLHANTSDAVHSRTLAKPMGPAPSLLRAGPFRRNASVLAAQRADLPAEKRAQRVLRSGASPGGDTRVALRWVADAGEG